MQREGSLTEVLRRSDFAPPGGYADAVAQGLAQKDMKISQLRRFFGEIKSFEAKCRQQRQQGTEAYELDEEFLLLPEVAYAVGRKLVPEAFYDLVRACINKDKVRSIDDMERFIEFMTAIVAYHKQYE
ncbi:MAG: type III-A CRISPR-associated protein Csm2 [Armatimonadota bacterium]|nr:type III-A CRISPR-associated protein Csm2 [Armatimonadota bacterium]